MIVDTHTHLGRNENMSARVDQLLRSMDEAKIDKALVFAGSINGVSTNDMIKEIAPHADRLYGVAAVELTRLNSEEGVSNQYTHAYAELLKEQLANPNVVAAKFYLGYEHFYPSAVCVKRAMRLIAKADKTAIFHTGDCFSAIKTAKLKYAHPLGIDDVAVDFPNTRIVIAHMGFPWVKDAAEVCYKNENVYADMSGFVYGKFDSQSVGKFQRMIHDFIDIAPSEKMLFGTDWPISDQSSYVRVVKDTLVIEELTDNAEKAFTL